MPRGLELLIAQTILQGFDAQYGRFLEVTSGAQQRFEQADWHAVQQAMKNRIHLYDHHVGLVVEQLRCITNGQSTDAAFLLRVKEHYTRLLPDYPRFVFTHVCLKRERMLRLLEEKIATPLGPLWVICDEQFRLRAVEWEEYSERMVQLLDIHYRKEGYERISATNPGGLSDKLREYFAGNLSIIDTLPTATGGTPFQREVWKTLRTIPAGR